MKSLRVHFFNRHGIDLDNPGSNASSSLLLALEQSNLPHLMQQGMAVAAAAAAFQNSEASNIDTSRSQENVTPPMHYLTPHVEISMADNNDHPVRIDSPGSNAISSGLDIQAIVRPKSNPTSSGSEAAVAVSTGGGSGASSGGSASSRQIYDSTITPSISLIPIKQEPNMNDGDAVMGDQKGSSSSMERASPAAGMAHDSGSLDGISLSTSNLTSLIKVYALEQLLYLNNVKFLYRFHHSNLYCAKT